MKLYGIENNYKTNKILAIANFTGVTVELVPAAYNNAPSKEFLKKYPNAKLPTLETEEGYLFGVAAIIRYFGLISKTALN
jgi:glutathione S-transferase